jgi:hypothetical protein
VRDGLKVSGHGLVVDRGDEARGGDLERLGETNDVLERDVAAATLDAAYVGAIEAGDVREFLLGESELSPAASHLCAKRSMGHREHRRHPTTVAACRLSVYGL